jgi:hypothetical protein
LSQAIALDPDYADAYQWRAIAYLTTDLTAAISDWTEVIRLKPREINGYLSRARTYNRLGDVERALADLDAAIALNPGGGASCILHCAKADILFIDQRLPEALTEYRASLKSQPLMAAPAVGTLVARGVVGVLADSLEYTKLQEQEMDVYKEHASERIQICEAIVSRINSNETQPTIFKGMSKQAVLQSVLVTDRIVGDNRVPISRPSDKGKRHVLRYPEPECQVTLTRAGPLEDRTIGVLVFKDNKLMVEKRVPLKDVSLLPRVLSTQTLISSGQPRAQVLAAFRLTDKLIYEDDDFIVSVTEDLLVRDKRVRVTMFSDSKVILSQHGSRPLW